MNIIALSEKEIKSSNIYSPIREKHVVISISGSEDTETLIPNNINRLGTLFLKFDDVEDINEKYIYFDRGQAKEILQFIEKFCSQVSLIIVQCQAGLSRSVAVASALSKIINNSDDYIFTKGIPNMFVYTTILDCFYSNPNWQTDYSRMAYLKTRAMCETLAPATVRLYTSKEKKRLQV